MSIPSSVKVPFILVIACKLLCIDQTDRTHHLVYKKPFCCWFKISP